MPFDAFLSYSHSEDKLLASAIQNKLQQFAKPWYHRRSIRVFLDETSLTAAPELWPRIEAQLAQSENLLLLYSPAAAASLWISREVSYWLESKSAKSLLLIFYTCKLHLSDMQHNMGIKKIFGTTFRLLTVVVWLVVMPSPGT